MTTNYYKPDDLIFIQSRAQLDQATVDEYAAMMAEDVGFDPAHGISAGPLIYIYDGQHRGEAARKAGKLLFVSVRPGTQEEAEWLALAANQKHGLRRSNVDKRRVVELALQHPNGAQMSDNQIAAHCGVSQPFVSKMRAELAVTYNDYKSNDAVTGKLLQSTTRIGADGRTINTTNIGRSRAEETEAYVEIRQLEQAVKSWLENEHPQAPGTQIAALQAIKSKTDSGPALLEQLLAGDALPRPHRKGDVIQACNNVLNQLNERRWKQERAEHIKTMVCLCGQPTLEPVGQMDAIRCTSCGKGWNSVAHFKAALPEPQAPPDSTPDVIPSLNGERSAPDVPAPAEDAELYQQLHRALHARPNATSRWAKRREIGLDDEELLSAIGEEFVSGGATGYRTRNSDQPKFLAGLTGPALVAAVRKLLDIPYDGGQGHWDFAGVTTTQIESGLAALEQHSLPLDSQYANVLREELARRKNGDAINPTSESYQPSPTPERCQWNETLCTRFAALVARQTLVNLIHVENWLAEIEQKLSQAEVEPEVQPL